MQIASRLINYNEKGLDQHSVLDLAGKKSYFAQLKTAKFTIILAKNLTLL